MWLALTSTVQTKIMLINPDASATAQLAGQLKRFGYLVTCFTKSVGAVDAVIKDRPDWLVLDIDKPFFDPAVFCELVRRSVPIDKVRVILCSKTSELGIRDTVLCCCARGSVIKDQPVERIAAKIDSFVRKLSMVFPASEPQRIAAVRSYAILDTPPEDDFDDLTRRASHICRTPIALMSVVDIDRQWFKSKVGLTIAETPRAVSFCAHAIHDRTVFEVPDATRDERFAKNPLVTASPKIRFYAGAPILTSNGLALGTLCVIDFKPRDLTNPQRDALKTLSRQVMHLLELRRLRALGERRASNSGMQPAVTLSDAERQHMRTPSSNRRAGGV